jgi:hypothetical protein
MSRRRKNRGIGREARARKHDQEGHGNTPPQLTVPKLEPVMASIERRLKTASLAEVDDLVHLLSECQHTKSESDFILGLVRRAKSAISDEGLSESQVDALVREILEQIQWIRLRGSVDDQKRRVE